MKKIVVLVIFLLFLSTLFPISISIESSSNRTIYVDDDNIEGPWDGSKEYPYQIIWDAVNNATDGDTIFIRNGVLFMI